MKEHTSFIRWGIPGWTAAVSLVVFVVVDSFTAGDPRLFSELNNAVSTRGLWQAVLTGALVAAAGIPIGFILYQIYFYLRWSSPVSARGLFPPFINGRVEEMRFFKGDLDTKELSLGQDWRRQMIGNEGNFREFWDYMDPFLAEAYAHADYSGAPQSRQNFLLDVLHSLGASTLGVYLGYASYLLSKWHLRLITPEGMTLAFLVPLATLLLLSSEQKLRRFRLKYPAELFVLVLCFTYALLNPTLSAFLLVWVTVLVILIMLVAFRRESIWSVVLVFVFFVSQAESALRGSLDFWRSLDWPIILSTIVISGASIVLVKNRQNTRQRLSALQYYFIMTYLASLGLRINRRD